MTEPKVIRSEINREMTTIACECKNKMAKLRKPLITVKYKRAQSKPVIYYLLHGEWVAYIPLMNNHKNAKPLSSFLDG